MEGEGGGGALGDHFDGEAEIVDGPRVTMATDENGEYGGIPSLVFLLLVLLVLVLSLMLLLLWLSGYCCLYGCC